MLHEQHRVIERRVNRYRHGIVSKCRDKRPSRERRRDRAAYACPMDRTDPSLDAFSGWINRVLDEFKSDPERKWGITRVAEEAKTPRSALTRWRDGDWSKGVPTRESVRRFCINLGLRLDEPFAILGSDPAGLLASPTGAPEPLVQSPRERRLRAVLRDPDLLPDERARYEAMLDMIITDAEAALERRRNGDTASGS